MPISVDTQQALQLLERIQQQLRESNSTNANPTIEEDVNTLISVLDSPVFNTILTIQDSLHELKNQLHKHPSILPVDFDITPATGELLLNVPTDVVGNSDSFEPSSDPEQNYEYDPANAKDKLSQVKETTSNSLGEISIPTIVPPNYLLSAITTITTESYAEEFHRTIVKGARGREIHNIQLFKPDGSSLGFSVVGLRAEDCGELGIFVQEIQAAGIAGRDGRLQEGDQILAIDGQPLDSNISHQQAISILQQARGFVELIVARGGIPTPEQPIKDPEHLSEGSKESDMVLTTEWAQVEAVDLINDGTGLGFGIIGGKSTGVVVKTILAGGVADRDGRLRSGDHILQIGDVNLRRMGSEEVATVLRQSGSHVRIIVARPVDPTSPDYNALHSNAPIVPTRILADPEEVERHLTMFQQAHNGFGENIPDFIRTSELSHAKDDVKEEGSLSTPHLPEVGAAGEDLKIGEDLPEMETFEVELIKDQKGLGITIAGYVCEKEEISGIFVKSIAHGSAADVCKRIHVNDQIIEVDGRSLQGYTNHQAVEVLRNTGKIVKLRLARYLRGVKYQQLQQAIASGKLHLPVSATTQVQIHEPKQPSLIIDTLNQTADLEDSIDITNQNYTGTLDPKIEKAIKNKWEKIMGPGYEIVVAQLTKFREGGGLGISLEGTVDVVDGKEVCPHHYIRSILSEGPVGINGKLQSGDELLEANGKKLLGLNHIEVVSVLKELPINVRMICARSLLPGNRQPPSSTIINPTIAYPTFHSTDFDATSMPELNGRDGFSDNYGGSLTSLTPISDRLVKAKSDGSLAVVTSMSPELPYNKLKSRSLEPLTGLAMWSSEPQIIELVKGDRGLGFSILDYQDPMNPNETVIVIRSLVPGGVAQQDGRLIPGDRLLFVNDINLENASLDTAVQALKGAPKGVVRIGVAKPLPLPESTQSGQIVTEDNEINSLQEFSRKLSIDLPSSLPLIPPLNMDPVQVPDIIQYSDKTADCTPSEFGLKINEKIEDMTEYNVSPLPDALLQTVKIKKGNKPLGINVESTPSGINGILVKSIIKGSSIHKDGHIRAGDYILGINGVSLRNTTEQEALSILKEAENNSEVIIKYIPATDAAIHHQSAILTMQHAEELPISLPPFPPLPPAPYLPENHLPDDLPPSPPTSPPPPLEDDDDNALLQDIKSRLSPSEFIQINNTELEFNKDVDTVNKMKEVNYTIPILNFPESKRSFELKSPKPPVPFKPIRKKEDSEISNPINVSNKLSPTEKQKIIPLNIPGKTITSSSTTFNTNVSRQWGPERTIELWREQNRGLGISIVWGKVDTYPSSGPTTSGIFIKNVLPDSPAGITGNLKRGDRILEVDGYDLREATHNKAVEVIKNAKNPVKFIVQSLISMPKKLEIEAESNNELIDLQKIMNGNTSNSIENIFKEWPNDDSLNINIPDDKMQSWEELDIGPAPPPPPRTVSKTIHNPYMHKLKREKQDNEIMNINSNETEFDLDDENRISLELDNKDLNFEDEYGYSLNEIKKKYGDLKNEEIIIVNLEKGFGGLGLSLAGNKDRHKMSVFICGMHPNGNAARDGRIHIGDELLEVNGIVMYGRSHLNASALIKGISGPSYKIVLLRRKTALEDMAVKPLTQFPLLTNNEMLERYSQYKDVRIITVNKGNSGLGIMILEGKHAEAGQGIFISDIQDNSIAQQAGLSVGHMILAVNETELIGADYETAAALLKSIGGLVTLVVSNPHKTSSMSLTSEKEEIVLTELSQNDITLKIDNKKIEKASPPQPPPKPLHLSVKPPTPVIPPAISTSSTLQHITTSKMPTHKFKLLPMPPINIDDDALSSSSSSSQETINTQPDPKTCEIKPGQDVTIEISKQKMGLGLSIVGGSDTPLGAIIIHEVYPDGAAAVDGRLIPGDQILEVNGEDLREATHERAITALRQTPPIVQMVVFREEGQNHEEDIYDILEVELYKKSGRGLGLSIVGRKNGPGVFISEVVKGGIAEANGQLMQGDQILQVNTHDLKNSTQEYAAAILKTTMGKINMKIGRLKAGSRRSTSGSISSPRLDNNTEIPLQYKNITLQRGPEGLGFSIVGGYGSPHGNLPIYIKTVFNKGAAAEDGNLQQGDQIVAVNDQSLEGVTHEEAVNILKNAKGTVVLTVLT